MTKIWKACAIVVVCVLLGMVASALEKGQVTEFENDIKNLANAISQKYPNKCQVTKDCQKSVSAIWHSLNDYLDHVDSRVRDVCFTCSTSIIPSPFLLFLRILLSLPSSFFSVLSLVFLLFIVNLWQLHWRLEVWLEQICRVGYG